MNLKNAGIKSYQEALKRLIDGEKFYVEIEGTPAIISFEEIEIDSVIKDRKCVGEAFNLTTFGSNSNLCPEDALAIFAKWRVEKKWYEIPENFPCPVMHKENDCQVLLSTGYSEIHNKLTIGSMGYSRDLADNYIPYQPMKI